MVEYSDEDDEKQYWINTLEELQAEAEILEGLVANAAFKWSEDFGPVTTEGAQLLEAQAHLNSVCFILADVWGAAKDWQT